MRQVPQGSKSSNILKCGNEVEDTLQIVHTFNLSATETGGIKLNIYKNIISRKNTSMLQFIVTDTMHNIPFIGYGKRGIVWWKCGMYISDERITIILFLNIFPNIQQVLSDIHRCDNNILWQYTIIIIIIIQSFDIRKLFGRLFQEDLIKLQIVFI